MGIDLGITYLSVGVWLDEHNRVNIIHNDQGNKNYTFFHRGQRLIDDAAKNQAATNPENTVFGIFLFCIPSCFCCC